MFKKLHNKIGDFWWYSLMLFFACRIADMLNAFVGLWLVPKMVDPTELGAVMPLTNFAGFLAVPLVAFANTFRNELMRLSIAREFGKLKTLLYGVFLFGGIFLLISFVLAKLFFPLFLERIQIVDGSLGFIIIATAFVSATAPIYSSALQALKKFKEQSVIGILGAPVRLITMLISMPFRAITGYFVGQASMPAFSILTSIFFLRKELAVKPIPYWNKETLKKFSKIFIFFLIWGIAAGISNLVESMIIRQRLPQLESAGFYMATRFSDIATFLASAIVFTIFPFTAEKSANGEDTRPLVLKILCINAVFCLILALPFMIFGKNILEMLPHGDQYSAYWWSIPWMIAIVCIISTFNLFTMVEISANRFDFLKWYVPLDLIYPLLLLLATGHGYFIGIIPQSWTEFLTAHNIYSLKTMLLWMTIIYAIKAILCITHLFARRTPRKSLS
jgi:O-antigen/teichoic acid export membrane protein